MKGRERGDSLLAGLLSVDEVSPTIDSRDEMSPTDSFGPEWVLADLLRERKRVSTWHPPACGAHLGVPLLLESWREGFLTRRTRLGALLRGKRSEVT